MSLLTEASLVILPNAVKEGELLSIIPADGSGDMTAVRATTATLVNSEGVIEDCPYNLLSYSEQFDNASWVKLASTISANNTIAPNGLLTADKLVEDTSASTHRFISTSFATTSGIVYSFSIFLKKGEREYAYIRFNNSGGDIIAANINLLNGTVSQSIFGNITIIPYNNDWYRVIATGTSTSTSSGSVEIRTSNSPTYANYTGDGTSGIYLWGAQFVKGTQAKEYFPTTDRLNVPRLDYTNGSCPSILVEPQRTNLLLRSEEFNDAYWTKLAGASIIQNTVVSPNGTFTADTLVFDTQIGSRVERGILLNSIGNYTFSFYAKSDNLKTVGIRTGILGSATINVDITTEWQRFSVTQNLSVSGYAYPQIRSIDTLGGSIYIWGAQLEQGANATSYIPTVASAVTINADVISKKGISDLIGQTEGTIYFDGIVNNIKNAFSNILNTDKNLSLSTISLGKIKSDNKFLFTQMLGNGSSGSAIKLTSTNAFANGIRTKIAIRYKSGSFAMYINGNLESTSSSSFTNIGTKSELFLNDSVTFFNYQESVSFNSVVLFTSGLTNTELAQLTTL